MPQVTKGRLTSMNFRYAFKTFFMKKRNIYPLEKSKGLSNYLQFVTFSFHDVYCIYIYKNRTKL